MKRKEVVIRETMVIYFNLPLKDCATVDDDESVLKFV